MSNKSIGSSDVNSLVAKAWSQHYHHHNDDALQVFKDVVASNPDHIDAQYGYGLTLRAVGKDADAIEAFKKAKALVAVANDDRAPMEENQRYTLLSRMIEQQLVFLGAGTPVNPLSL